MRILKILMIRLSIIIFLVCIGLISIKIWGPDNRVEEVAEMAIEEMTGIDIDLSDEKEIAQNKSLEENE